MSGSLTGRTTLGTEVGDKHEQTKRSPFLESVLDLVRSCEEILSTKRSICGFRTLLQCLNSFSLRNHGSSHRAYF